MSDDFTRFEPLAGVRPTRVAARHPAGGYLALIADAPAAEARATLGIWEETTGALVWAAEDVAALTWTADGTQLLLWVVPAPAADVGTPGRFERRGWPADMLVGACTFTLPWTPWPYDLWVSAGTQLAVVRWLDEGLSGWEPIVLADWCDDRHLAGAGFALDSEVAIDTHPVLSPSGHYAVSGYQTSVAMTRHGQLVPRQQGRFEVGRVVVMDLHRRTFRDILLTDAVPLTRHGAAARWTDMPVFLDETHFRLLLPSGATRVFSTQE